MSSEEELERTRRFYDELSETFLRCAGPTFQAGLLRRPDGKEEPAWSDVALAQRGGVRPGHRVLDAGCGVGGPALHIAAGIADVRVEGLTLSPVQARMARERALEAGLQDRVRFEVGDYHALPYEDGSFDVVLFLESSEYSSDLPRLFAEALRVLAPGGRVYVKGALRREGALSDEQQRELEEYDAMWVVPRTKPPSEVAAAMRSAGFAEVTWGHLDLGSAHFIGAMWELGPEGLRRSAFGDALFRTFRDLPVSFAEVSGRRPG